LQYYFIEVAACEFFCHFADFYNYEFMKFIRVKG
jgi:hypothetical protein